MGFWAEFTLTFCRLLPFKSDRPGAVYPLGGWDLLPEPSTPESTQLACHGQKETLNKKDPWKGWVRFVESSKNASRFRNHHSGLPRRYEIWWNLGTWNDRNSPGGCLSEAFKSDGGISLAIAKTCENNPPRCHCLPGSQPNLHKTSIPLRISLEAETGGPKTANLEIFMFGASPWSLTKQILHSSRCPHPNPLFRCWLQVAMLNFGL